jgi:hypothetical protein
MVKNGDDIALPKKKKGRKERKKQHKTQPKKRNLRACEATREWSVSAVLSESRNYMGIRKKGIEKSRYRKLMQRS